MSSDSPYLPSLRIFCPPTTCRTFPSAASGECAQPDPLTESPVRRDLRYVSERVNAAAVAARTTPSAQYSEVCDALAAELDARFGVAGTRVLMLNPDSGLNTATWPILYKSDNVAATEEDPATRIELFSQIQSREDWLCARQVNGQAYRVSSTTGLPTLYSTSSILDAATGLTRLTLKAAVPAPTS